jgi:predicted glycogen debranching enzyme
MTIDPTQIVRSVPIPRGEGPALEALVGREWLVTNGLGGYASGTIGGVMTRRYHGLLVASLRNPLGRMVMLNHLVERVSLADGRSVALGAHEQRGRNLELPAAAHLREFHLEAGLPVWRYEIDGIVLERRVVMPYRQNTVQVHYHVLPGSGASAPASVRLELQPAIHFRGYEAPVSTPLTEGYRIGTVDGHFVVQGAEELPPLRLAILGAQGSLTVQEGRLDELLFRVEEARGYEYQGTLWTPGFFSVSLAPGERATLVASTHSWETMSALDPDAALRAERERRRRLLTFARPAAGDTVAAELVLAADQFVITPAGRQQDAVRAWAVGDDIRTIIAGYHWFTDWGRDTMISLEGLTVTTGRLREGGAILRAFAQHVRDGLIPNMFPDGSDEGLYHTADATLWFFHAIHRFAAATGDLTVVDQLLPVLESIVAHHLSGTRFGIGVDPADGLLRPGAEGYQLTWMDAKVDGWVVTPRRGKAVEINALWYNALRLLEGWLRDRGRMDDAARIAGHAARAYASFNARFPIPGEDYLHDVVDGPEGDSRECRPNQLFAISLDHPVLAQERWAPVLRVVRERLLTPVGLRSLAPGSANYQPWYKGDLRSRDAAYHQGTVWGWLVGPFVDAWLRVHPDDREGARSCLTGLVAHLNEFGVGSVAEIFDAEPPYIPRGCIAQAWSVAELLRCWVKTAG